MECVIFTGIPATGKSTFYQARFFRTHVRINLDMLKTRTREAKLLAACLAMKQRFVVDHTNILAIAQRLNPPVFAEGYDALHEVRIVGNGRFAIRPVTPPGEADPTRHRSSR